MIEKLYTLQQKMDKSHRIREAWSFDWQNHGDAAILNRQLLKVQVGGVSMSIASFSTFVLLTVRKRYMNGGVPLLTLCVHRV